MNEEPRYHGVIFAAPSSPRYLAYWRYLFLLKDGIFRPWYHATSITATRFLVHVTNIIARYPPVSWSPRELIQIFAISAQQSPLELKEIPGKNSHENLRAPLTTASNWSEVPVKHVAFAILPLAVRQTVRLSPQPAHSVVESRARGIF